MIYGIVKAQKLDLRAAAAADTIDYLTAKFSFMSADWDGLVKYAHFQQGNTRYSVQLTDDKITESDHLNLAAGEWQVYLHGNEYKNGEVIKRVTTNIATFTVEPTGALNGEPFPEVEASVVEQIEADIADHEERITDLENTAGEFVKDVETADGTSVVDENGVAKIPSQTDNNYTDTDKAKLDSINVADITANTAARHTHSNKSVLDKFGESSGTPTYDGEPIGGGGTITDVKDEQGNSLVDDGVATIPDEVVWINDGPHLAFTPLEIQRMQSKKDLRLAGMKMLYFRLYESNPKVYIAYYLQPSANWPFWFDVEAAYFNEDGSMISMGNHIGTLSKENFTTEEKTKLQYIASGAQVNVIETIKKSDGTALPITNKAVTLPEIPVAPTDAEMIEVCSILADFITDGTNIIGVDSTTALAF